MWRWCWYNACDPHDVDDDDDCQGHDDFNACDDVDDDVGVNDCDAHDDFYYDYDGSGKEDADDNNMMLTMTMMLIMINSSHNNYDHCDDDHWEGWW